MSTAEFRLSACKQSEPADSAGIRSILYQPCVLVLMLCLFRPPDFSQHLDALLTHVRSIARSQPLLGCALPLFRAAHDYTAACQLALFRPVRTLSCLMCSHVSVRRHTNLVELMFVLPIHSMPSPRSYVPIIASGRTIDRYHSLAWARKVSDLYGPVGDI